MLFLAFLISSGNGNEVTKIGKEKLSKSFKFFPLDLVSQEILGDLKKDCFKIKNYVGFV